MQLVYTFDVGGRSGGGDKLKENSVHADFFYVIPIHMQCERERRKRKRKRGEITYNVCGKDKEGKRNYIAFSVMKSTFVQGRATWQGTRPRNRCKVE